MQQQYSAKRKRSSNVSRPVKKRYIQRRGNAQQMLIGKSNIMEIKCKDQVFTPGAALATTTIGNVAYVEPTAAGLGLATGYSCINTMNNGSQKYERIGDKVVIKSISVEGTIASADDADLTDNGLVRCMLIYDKQCNGAAPAITSIIQSEVATGAQSTIFSSPIKMSNRKRFVVLRDEYHSIGGQAGDSVKHIKWFVKQRLETNYNGTDAHAAEAAVTRIATGAIYFLIFTDSAIFTHLPRLSNFHIRVRYFD